MITLTRSGKLLTLNASTIPSQGSSDIPVQFVNDTDEFKDYLIEPRIGWYTRNGFLKTQPAKYQDGIIYLPYAAFRQPGNIALNIALVDPSDGAHIEALSPVIAKVVPAPLGKVVLPETDVWEQAVIDLVTQLNAQLSEQVQQAINTANQANTAAQQVVNEANEKLEAVGTATTAANAATGAANTAASSANEAASSANTAAKATNTATSNANAATKTANTAATAANNAAESVRIVYSGESAPTDETGKDNDMYIVTGSGDEAGDFYVKESGTWVKKMSLKGATSVYMGNDLQTAIDLAGACFYVGEDDESYHLGTYAEWVSAGKPAFPSE